MQWGALEGDHEAIGFDGGLELQKEEEIDEWRLNKTWGVMIFLQPSRSCIKFILPSFRPNGRKWLVRRGIHATIMKYEYLKMIVLGSEIMLVHGEISSCMIYLAEEMVWIDRIERHWDEQRCIWEEQQRWTYKNLKPIGKICLPETVSHFSHWTNLSNIPGSTWNAWPKRGGKRIGN